MGAFSDIFGNVPKVLILETLAENSDDNLTIRDIIEETSVSRREVYLLIRRLVKDGLVLESGNRPKKYKLNANDLRAITLIRAEPLLIMGKLEYELKIDDNIPVNEPYPESYLYSTNINYYHDDNFKTEKSYDVSINNPDAKDDFQESITNMSDAEPVGA